MIVAALLILACSVLFMTWRVMRLDDTVSALEAQVHCFSSQLKEPRVIVPTCPPPMAPFITQITPIAKRGRSKEQKALASKLKKEWWAKKKASEQKTPEAVVPLIQPLEPN